MLLFIVTCMVVFNSCNAQSSNPEDSKQIHEHSFDLYGCCEGCSYVSEETMKSLESVVKACCFTDWYINYEISPYSDDMTVRFDSVKFSGNTAITNGTILVKHNSYTFKSEFDVVHIWDEEKNMFVRDSHEYSTYFAVDENENVINTTFDTYKEFTHYYYTNNSKARSVLTLIGSDFYQEIYNVSGTRVDTSYATYSMKICPTENIITVSVSGRDPITMTYFVYAGEEVIAWGDEYYFCFD